MNKLTALIGGPSDSAAVRSKLRAMNSSSASQAAELSDKVKALARSGSSSPRGRLASQKLTKDATVWLGELKTATARAQQKEREFPMNTSEMDGFADGEDWSGISAAGGLHIPASYGQQHETEQEDFEAQRLEIQQLEAERETHSAITMEREEGVREIEAAVLEVNEIFTDLASLVQDQGAHIDNIESNIVDTGANVEGGVEQLRKASKHQKKSRSLLCCLLLFLIVATGVLAFLFIYVF
jgi:hypothetical protein